MTDTKETDNDTGTDKGERKSGSTLSLKGKVDSGTVFQNFSHGRANKVQVERKRKRTIQPASSPSRPAATPAAPTPPVVEAKPKRRMAKPGESGGKPSAGSQRSGGSSNQGDGLTRKLSSAEKDARLRALAAARAREAEEKVRAEEDAKRRAAEEAQRAKDEAEARRREEEEAKRKAEEEAAKAAEASAAGQAAASPTDAAPAPAGRPAPAAARRPTAEPAAPAAPATDRSEKADASGARAADARAKKVPMRPEKAPVQTPKRDTSRRVRGKLTIASALDDNERQRSISAYRRQQERRRRQQMGGPKEAPVKVHREVILPEVITIQELSNRMSERGVDIIKFLMKQGDMYKITDVIDADTAELIAEEFGHTVKRVTEADVEDGFIGEEDAPDTLEPRAPIVTIMGHVDHGKTSLLDAIRQANVVSGEAGGITQHIGAYQVETPTGDLVTFIDTPGHAAFTAMRARGAQVTDIVILVVAADDGVMPQTIEAIAHAKAAEVPIIVAINKMDKPNVDPNKVRTELLQHEIVVESMSGDVQDIPVSALKKEGLDTLLEAISLQAEVLELKANPDRSAEGVVAEAKLERGRGPVGTVLVQRGTLRVGHIVVAGTAWGKVRALINDQGQHVKEAGPSIPVEVLGFNSAPEAGDQFAVVESEARAREITEFRERQRRDTLTAGAGTARTLEQMMSQLKEAGKKEFPLVIKGDVQGSVEAIQGSLQKLGTDEVEARIVHAAVGGVTESDVQLATASNAVIVAFNVRANTQAQQAASQQGVEVRQYAVIYDVIDDVKAAMSGMLAPTIREHFLGNAKILEIFNISKLGKVAGCQVVDGKVARGASVRLIRDDVVVHEGKLSTLKRFKDEVKEVQVGQECGMAFENYQDMRAGDVIECFTTEEVQRTLDD